MGDLADSDWDRIGGRRNQLAGKIQERSGRAGDQAEGEADEWVSRP